MCTHILAVYVARWPVPKCSDSNQGGSTVGEATLGMTWSPETQLCLSRSCMPRLRLYYGEATIKMTTMLTVPIVTTLVNRSVDLIDKTHHAGPVFILRTEMSGNLGPSHIIPHSLYRCPSPICTCGTVGGGGGGGGGRIVHVCVRIYVGMQCGSMCNYLA